MAGVRRRLLDVGKTVTGVLGARLPEGGEAPADPTADDLTADDRTADDRTADDPTVGGAQDEDPVTEPEGQAPPDAPSSPADPEPADPEPADPEPAQPDPVLVGAVDLALSAAREVGGAAVGEHLGVTAEVQDGADGPVATHAFATTERGYVGWHWAVTVARGQGDERVTVDEVVLLPGTGALLAPAWLPWSERLRPGDLSAGDLLLAPPDDERLVPAYADTGDEELVGQVYDELGLGRARVLSAEGRLDAAERWWEGEAGPDAPASRQAPGRCGDCGFLVPLAGGLRAAFGVCANGYAPDDGRVVALVHGCGAFSETVMNGAHAATAPLAVGQEELELVPATELPATEPPDTP